MRSGSEAHLSPGGRKWDVGSVLLEGVTFDRPLDFTAIFGNARPVELEIGTGKGTFLLARASARPEVNFLGVEWAGAYGRYAADRFRRAGLSNVRMLVADAGDLVSRGLQPASLLRMHIYFPDPWPKRRHHRRRLIQPPFIQAARRALVRGGQLLIVTDHRDYFTQIQRVMASAEGFATTDFPAMADERGEVVGTNFERKYIAQGRAFYKLARLRYR